MKSVRNRKVVGELAFGVLIAVRLREQGPTQGRWKLWMREEEEEGKKIVRGGQREE